MLYLSIDYDYLIFKELEELSVPNEKYLNTSNWSAPTIISYYRYPIHSLSCSISISMLFLTCKCIGHSLDDCRPPIYYSTILHLPPSSDRKPLLSFLECCRWVQCLFHPLASVPSCTLHEPLHSLRSSTPSSRLLHPQLNPRIVLALLIVLSRCTRSVILGTIHAGSLAIIRRSSLPLPSPLSSNPSASHRYTVGQFLEFHDHYLFIPLILATSLKYY